MLKRVQHDTIFYFPSPFDGGGGGHAAQAPALRVGVDKTETIWFSVFCLGLRVATETQNMPAVNLV